MTAPDTEVREPGEVVVIPRADELIGPPLPGDRGSGRAGLQVDDGVLSPPERDGASQELSPDEYMRIYHPGAFKQLDRWLRAYRPRAFRAPVTRDYPRPFWIPEAVWPYIHPDTKSVIARETFPFTLQSMVFSGMSMLNNFYAFGQLGMGRVIYPMTQMPGSVLRDLAGQTMYGRPVVTDRHVNTLLSILMAGGLAHGTEWGAKLVSNKLLNAERWNKVVRQAINVFGREHRIVGALESMRGMPLASGVPWTIAKVNAGFQVIGWLKDFTTTPTLDIAGKVVLNPVGVLVPDEYVEGRAVYHSSLKYWGSKLWDAFAVGFPYGFFIARSTEGDLRTKLVVFLTTAPVVGGIMLVTSVATDPPQPGDPVMRAIEYTGIPPLWRYISNAWNHPTPDSFDENLTSLGINGVELGARILYEAGRWPFWLQSRNAITQKALEARSRGDHRESERLLADPDNAWFDPKAVAAITATHTRATAAWKGVLDSQPESRIARAVQTPLLAADLVDKAPQYLGHIAAEAVEGRRLNPPQRDRLAGAIGRDVTKLRRQLGLDDATTAQALAGVSSVLGPADAAAAPPPGSSPPPADLRGALGGVTGTGRTGAPGGTRGGTAAAADLTTGSGGVTDGTGIRTPTGSGDENPTEGATGTGDQTVAGTGGLGAAQAATFTPPADRTTRPPARSGRGDRPMPPDPAGGRLQAPAGKDEPNDQGQPAARLALEVPDRFRLHPNGIIEILQTDLYPDWPVPLAAGTTIDSGTGAITAPDGTLVGNLNAPPVPGRDDPAPTAADPAPRAADQPPAAAADPPSGQAPAAPVPDQPGRTSSLLDGQPSSEPSSQAATDLSDPPGGSSTTVASLGSVSRSEQGGSLHGDGASGAEGSLSDLGNSGALSNSGALDSFGNIDGIGDFGDPSGGSANA
ncbi:MAG TPA: hypothetical protein VKG45_01130 [Actinomycetes bacterium]|nr:hypothetical protein [Actinomycetes bacterium]